MAMAAEAPQIATAPPVRVPNWDPQPSNRANRTPMRGRNNRHSDQHTGSSQGSNFRKGQAQAQQGNPQPQALHRRELQAGPPGVRRSKWKAMPSNSPRSMAGAP